MPYSEKFFFLFSLLIIQNPLYLRGEQISFKLICERQSGFCIQKILIKNPGCSRIGLPTEMCLTTHLHPRSSCQSFHRKPADTGGYVCLNHLTKFFNICKFSSKLSASVRKCPTQKASTPAS